MIISEKVYTVYRREVLTRLGGVIRADWKAIDTVTVGSAEDIKEYLAREWKGHNIGDVMEYVETFHSAGGEEETSKHYTGHVTTTNHYLAFKFIPAN